MCIWESQCRSRENVWKNNGQNIPYLVKYVHLHIQEAQRTPGRINSKRSTQRHIVVKLSKPKETASFYLLTCDIWVIWFLYILVDSCYFSLSFIIAQCWVYSDVSLLKLHSSIDIEHFFMCLLRNLNLPIGTTYQPLIKLMWRWFKYHSVGQIHLDQVQSRTNLTFILLAKLDLRNSVFMWGLVDEEKKKTNYEENLWRNSTEERKGNIIQRSKGKHISGGWGKDLLQNQCNIWKLFCIFRMIWEGLDSIKKESKTIIWEPVEMKMWRKWRSLFEVIKKLKQHHGELARKSTHLRNSPWINWKVTKMWNGKIVYGD